jgi:hypothetical protein
MLETLDIAQEPSNDLEVDYLAAPAVVCALDVSADGRRVTRLAARLARHLRWRLVLVPQADGEESERLVAAATDERGGLIVARAPKPAPAVNGEPQPQVPLAAAAPCPVVSLPRSFAALGQQRLEPGSSPRPAPHLLDTALEAATATVAEQPVATA